MMQFNICFLAIRRCFIKRDCGKGKQRSPNSRQIIVVASNLVSTEFGGGKEEEEEEELILVF